MQHKVYRTRQHPQMSGNRGPHSAADPVARHRASKHFANSKSNSRPGKLLVGAQAVQGSNISGEAFFWLLVHALEVRMFQQPRAPGKPGGRTVRNSLQYQPQLSKTRLLPEARLHGNALAPFGAATGEYRPAALCLHSGTKTVHLGTAATVRLKRALGHWAIALLQENLFAVCK